MARKRANTDAIRVGSLKAANPQELRSQIEAAIAHNAGLYRTANPQELRSRVEAVIAQQIQSQ